MDCNIYKVSRQILYKELSPLWETISTIKYAVVKGEALSQQIYGFPDQRKSGDIDILIDRMDVKFLESQLVKLGFTQCLPSKNAEARSNRVLCMAYSHQIPSYHKEKLGFHLNVDINFDIFWGEYEGQRYSIDEFLDDAVDMQIYGVKMKTLPIDKAFVQLVLHHYKEMNSIYHLSQQNTICTSMFRDIYDMIILNSSILTVERIHELSVKYGIMEFVYYMLYYAYCVFGDNQLKPYLSELRFCKNESIMDCYGLCAKERKRWLVPFEKRLNNDSICRLIYKDMLHMDFQKVILEKSVFT